MRVEQLIFHNNRFIKNSKSEPHRGQGDQLVLGFGAKSLLEQDAYINLKMFYPHAQIVLCSTSGEIYDDQVYDDSISVVAVEFDKTKLQLQQANIKDFGNSFEAGRFLFSSLPGDELSYAMIISDGGMVNGSELLRGVESVNHHKIPVTGGLAGDAADFNYTVVGANSLPEAGNIVLIGFYGKALTISHSSSGGWEMFGAEKKVTLSSDNKLFEIDGQNALEMYKEYLGKSASGLPGSALLFPLALRLNGSKDIVVRTILSIDQKGQSMTFAGDIPQGSHVRFMRGDFDKLIGAAANAALGSLPNITARKPKLALLISCVGRKLILGKRIIEETSAVKKAFGSETVLTGFYSYGEISPLSANKHSQLHNQTITITTFNES